MSATAVDLDVPPLVEIERRVQERAKDLNKFIKALGIKGIQSQTQGEQVRVIGKKRDELQQVITACKDHDFGIPLQFGNFRD